MKGANDVRSVQGTVKATRKVAKGHVWPLGLVWALAIFAVLQPFRFAMADSNNFVIISGAAVFTAGSNDVGVGWEVAATNVYNGGLLVCGVDVGDARLTSDVKAKLSNASTGGAFYTFCQMFIKITSKTQQPSWTQGTNAAFGEVWNILSENSPYDIYYVECDQEDIDAAKRDLNKVINGEDLGGSSGSGEFPNPLIFDGVGKVYDNGQVKDATEFTLNLDEYTLNGYGNDKGFNDYDYDNIYGFVVANLRDQSANIVNIYVYKTDGTITYTQVPLSKKQIYDKVQQKFVEVQTYTYKINITGASYVYIHDNYQGGYNSSFGRRTLGWIVPTEGNTATQISHEGTAIYTYNGETKPVTPPTNWPTDPTPTPKEPPEVPEPPTTTPPTQPTPPTSPTPPTYQPQPVYVTTTFTADLQGILDAMDEHCQHIQNALYQNAKNIYEDLTTYLSDKYEDLKLILDGNFGYIGETIDDGLEDLKDYLWDLFKWLKDNMQFSFTAPEYDDSSVLSWLKKIYSKMGTGIRSKPVDPVVDPVGAWNWLEQLIQGILGALSNAVGGLTGTVGELFNGIKDKFPFSIPWDLAAILALFDAAPVTPQAEIDYTIFEGGPVSIPVHWDINMHYLDDTMGTVRAMEDIVFCFYLLMKTDWLSSVFDGIGEYLGGRYRAALRS